LGQARRKSQVTIEYDGQKPLRVHTVVLSTQHDESVVDRATGRISEAARRTLIDTVIRPAIPDPYWNDKIIFHVNPTGLFLVSGPHGDTGLAGQSGRWDTQDISWMS
jgi:S-adenosylmethionine synthetase